MSTFYLTTPIYYPNARPHVGSAYTTIVCDVLARYKRMCGYDVAFLTGTDEHGEKLERAAKAAGQTPSEFVAEKRKLFIQLWEKLGMSVSEYPYADLKPDSLRFIATTHPDHERSVQRLLVRARERGYVEKRRYEGRYCIFDERYISEGTDPVNCDICGRPAELISEENYFFKLSAFQDRLLELYEKHPEFVQPDYRRNEVLSFVRSGLRDISISRKRLKWGIPWPDDPEQVFYVWYDALTSYMTGIGYAQGDEGNAEFKKYWRNKPGEAELVHMMAKDILRFHAIYWPAFIMAAYPDQPEMLPTKVFAHGWIYYEQDKMSKSKGNVVYPEPIIDALNSFGAPGNDALRYYLLREAPFGQDTSFSYEGLIQRYNSDLANDLGNLVNRTVTMIGRCPGAEVSPLQGTAMDADVPLLCRSLDGLLEEYRRCLDRYDLARALALVSAMVADLNGYLNRKKPWETAASLGRSPFPPGSTVRPSGHEARSIEKSENARQLLNETLYVTADALRCIVALVAPIIPQSSQRMWEQLGCEGKVSDQRIDQLKCGEQTAGTRVGKPEPIFPRLDKAKALAKLDELAEVDRERGKPTAGALREAPLRVPVQLDLTSPDGEPDKSKEALRPVQTENKPETVTTSTSESSIPGTQSPAPSLEPAAPGPQAPTLITIEDFAKVEMRVGEVKAAEHVPGASKLLKLMVDIGTEVRQLVAGLAEHYRPEDLIGMKVAVVTNLQPRKLRGVESNGMIIAASAGDHGRPVLVTFKDNVENGARLK